MNNKFTLEKIPLIGVHGNAKWMDYNNDNQLDLIVQGDTSEPTLSGLTKLYKNEGNNIFKIIDEPFYQITAGNFEPGDFNNDGRVDLLISGYDEWTVTGLYKNEGNDIFTDTKLNIPPMQNPVLSWVDIDNDSDMDLLMIGMRENVSLYTQFYRNDGPSTDSAWSLTEIKTPIMGLDGQGAWGDYDNDGDLDFIISGWSTSSRAYFTKLYRNDGKGVFTEVYTNIKVSGKELWGDYDNDGKLDLMIGSQIFHNDGNGIFTKVDLGTTSVLSSLAWGDFNGNGNLDLVGVKNGQLAVFKNNFNNHNTPPTAPQNLHTSIEGGTVYLSWNRATDEQTPSLGLSYNLFIGTSKDSCNIMSPMADLKTGFRKVAKLGNVDEDTAWFVRNLKPGKYYWSVQAIDNGYEGSKFASVDSFTVTLTGVKNVENSVPKKYSLEQNYPNPFNPSTTINYSIPKTNLVTIKVFDILGNEVALLVNEEKSPGNYKVNFNASKFASGVYIYRIQAGNFTQAKKLLLMK